MGGVWAAGQSRGSLLCHGGGRQRHARVDAAHAGAALQILHQLRQPLLGRLVVLEARCERVVAQLVR